jgi:hypothetical protein
MARAWTNRLIDYQKGITPSPLTRAKTDSFSNGFTKLGRHLIFLSVETFAAIYVRPFRFEKPGCSSLHSATKILHKNLA